MWKRTDFRGKYLVGVGKNRFMWEIFWDVGNNCLAWENIGVRGIKTQLAPYMMTMGNTLWTWEVCVSRGKMLMTVRKHPDLPQQKLTPGYFGLCIKSENV